MTPTLGVRVFVTLDASTARKINRRAFFLGGRKTLPGSMLAGYVTHVASNECVNVKLLCDGPFDLRIQDVQKWNGVPGQSLRTWRWPM